MAPFDLWVDYYDVLQKGIEGDVEFYVAQALRADGRTLELGCGTGRICIPMAMSGVDVVGLDHSPAMLQRCREKYDAAGPTTGHLELVEADMGDFSLDRKFAFIAMPYRTFMHLLEPVEQQECLRAVRRHLAPGGLFVLNTWAARPSTIAPHLGPQKGMLRLVDKYRDPAEGNGLLHYCASTYDEWSQLFREDHIFHEMDPMGAILRMTSLEMVRAWTTPREMEFLVQLCGFEVDAVFGDFSCAPFTRGSTEMIWALRASEG